MTRDDDEDDDECWCRGIRDRGDRELRDLLLRVNEIACAVLGHRIVCHEAEHAGYLYRWAYCHRCGRDQRGLPPPYNWSLFEMPIMANAILTGIRDRDLAP